MIPPPSPRQRGTNSLSASAVKIAFLYSYVVNGFSATQKIPAG